MSASTTETRLEEAPGVRRPRRWTDRSFLEEMLSFTLLMDHMPTQDELVAAGRGDLAAQVSKRGGYVAVAEAIGLESKGTITDEQIEREVRSLAGDLGRLPTKREFEDAGELRIHNAMVDRGGLDAWARRLGLQRCRAHRWTDEAIREALKRLIGDGEYWPSIKEFRETGLGGLASAIGHGAERDRWMAEFGVKDRNRFDEVRHEKEMREFTEGMVAFPTRTQFKEAGLHRLLAACREHGGLEHWAARLGLRFEGRGLGVTPRHYDTPEFVAEMRRFCKGRATMPSHDELKNAGRADLSHQVSKHGGVQQVAELLGMETRPRYRRSDADLESELRELVGDSGRFPSCRQFEEAGKSALYQCLMRRGGSKFWAQRLGLEIRRRGRRWADTEMEIELGKLLADLGRFPRASDFEEAGQGGLRAAIKRRGGSAVWAARLGVDPPAAGRRRGAGRR